jgi:DNA-binding FadR family transcriptional regulator|tara:strand:+ start:23053 stop:23817 length:765 start_codon:yes stop_codon:yes gene_type:complete
VLVSQIKQDIIAGRYPEGTRLPTENEMATQLSVSRPTVREGLRLLEAEGLISTRPGPGGGPRVMRPDVLTVTRSLTTLFQYERVTLGELLEARRAIEPACAQHVAATHASIEDVAKLRESIERMEAALADDEIFWNENANFHLSLVHAGQNRVLHTMMTALRELIYGFTAGLHIAADERVATIDEHSAIMQAIAENDSETAARATHDHLLKSEERLREEYPDLLQSVGLAKQSQRGEHQPIPHPDSWLGEFEAK